ncbi:hypothetical protein [Photobacterium profundum]|uniref:Uncharacterized protein n=1 Tax=Photobacterium profundum (strain SS9) TaxID=298386 RepID=Q6LRQ2_PHOPR|nr:hypothetical protein [Photobacterium profundum]CAG20024.1 hypothetical protein PBPRA1613 [Photobacterium profundum SS9]
MEQAHNTTLSRIGHSFKVFLKFLWNTFFFLLGGIGLGFIPFDIFEYSFSFSELAYSEIIFLLAFILLTRNYWSQARSSQTNIFKIVYNYLIPQGYLLALWFIAFIALYIQKNEDFIYEPILEIVSSFSILAVIVITTKKIKTNKLAIPAPKEQIKLENSQDNLQ